MSEAVRIANCSGFYGDRLSAAREMVDGGPIDFLTGDYLAELTMMILWKAQRRDPDTGYAVTFLTQLEQVLGTAMDHGVKIVANAGGLNPASLAARVRELAERLGLQVNVAHIEGDDLRGRLRALQDAGHDLAHLDTGRPLRELDVPVVTANAYLGAWGIVEALDRGADVVVCPRVTDAALTVGPAAWRHGWERDDWDALASAVVAGHIIECGAQATGGNYAFFTEVPNLRHPGFPLVEIDPNGDFTVTKHPGTGGEVSVGTVTAQLLYEIAGPRYLTPDVVARFDTIELAHQGQDRVRVTGVRGEPAPAETKVACNYVGGYRNSVTLVLTGLNIEEKAALVTESLFDRLGGRDQFAEVNVQLIRTDQPDAPSLDTASAHLRINVKDADAAKVGRSFSRALVELGLASYPGFHATGVPSREQSYAVYWPCLMPATEVEQSVVDAEGNRITVPPTAAGPGRAVQIVPPPLARIPGGEQVRLPLGRVFGARSGDKGGNANVGVWARSDAGYAWLLEKLTVDRFRDLVPESAGLTIDRYEFPRLRAVNFVVWGLLGEGVAASTRSDPQAKGLGEYLRSRLVELPAALLEEA